eukprot:1100954-Prymnesium_polylepis.1
MPKAAKVTHPPRRPLNCESDPPLKTLLPPRAVLSISSIRLFHDRCIDRYPQDHGNLALMMKGSAAAASS